MTEILNAQGETVNAGPRQPEEPWPQAPHVGPNRIDVRPLVQASLDLLEEIKKGPAVDPLAFGGAKILRGWTEMILKRCYSALDGFTGIASARCVRCIMPIDQTGRCYSCAMISALATIAESSTEPEIAEIAQGTLGRVFALADRDIEPGYRAKRDQKIVDRMAVGGAPEFEAATVKTSEEMKADVEALNAAMMANPQKGRQTLEDEADALMARQKACVHDFDIDVLEDIPSMPCKRCGITYEDSFADAGALVTPSPEEIAAAQEEADAAEADAAAEASRSEAEAEAEAIGIVEIEKGGEG